uniref:Uncharacterized protein n=1 Tax=Anguilla anguilla TaxID=7936 RepID=A0A0E9VRK5_ANGAN
MKSHSAPSFHVLFLTLL